MNENTFLWASRKKGDIIFKISLNTNQNVRSVRKYKAFGSPRIKRREMKS